MSAIDEQEASRPHDTSTAPPPLRLPGADDDDNTEPQLIRGID